MERATRRTPALRFELGSDPAGPATSVRGVDRVVVEEPLQIRVDGADVVMTMRTPGDDVDLALGWLAAEAGLTSPADVASVRPCGDRGPDGLPTYNTLDVTLAPGVTLPPDVARDRPVSSACGVCGADTVAAVARRGGTDIAADPLVLDPRTLLALPDLMRPRQRRFDATGGTHAAALVDAAGEVVCLREDVGRHNAVDKVVGDAVRRGALPLTGHVLVVSGRAGFEITQKAALAGIPALVSVSATTAMSVDLAREVGMTLVGFVRAGRGTVYAGGHRIRSGT